MWQDKRARAECDWIEERIGRKDLYYECGLRLDPYFSLPKMLWLRGNEPEFGQRPRSFWAFRTMFASC
jgi:xylulokinase/glycerol kinase